MTRTVITSKSKARDDWKSILDPIKKERSNKPCLGAFKGTKVDSGLTDTEKQYNRIVDSIQSDTGLILSRKAVLIFIRMFYRAHYKKELNTSNTYCMRLIKDLLDSGNRNLDEFGLCAKYVEWTYYHDKYRSGQYKDMDFNPNLFRQGWLLDCYDNHKSPQVNSSFV